MMPWQAAKLLEGIEAGDPGRIRQELERYIVSRSETLREVPMSWNFLLWIVVLLLVLCCVVPAVMMMRGGRGR